MGLPAPAAAALSRSLVPIRTDVRPVPTHRPRSAAVRRAARWLEGRLRRQLRARARLTIRPFTTPTVPVSDPGQVATSSAYRLGSHPTWSLAVAFPSPSSLTLPCELQAERSEDGRDNSKKHPISTDHDPIVPNPTMMLVATTIYDGGSQSHVSNVLNTHAGTTAASMAPVGVGTRPALGGVEPGVVGADHKNIAHCPPRDPIVTAPCPSASTFGTAG